MLRAIDAFVQFCHRHCALRRIVDALNPLQLKAQRCHGRAQLMGCIGYELSLLRHGQAEPGQAVRTGQRLFALDGRDFEQSQRAAQAQHAARVAASLPKPPGENATLADIINIDEGFIKTPAGKGFALVGPDFNDPKYFGKGAGIAVRKGDSENAARISAAIDAIRANGTYQDVQAKYFEFDIYGK